MPTRATVVSVAAVRIELLYFDGCSNHQAMRELVERIATKAGIEADLRLVGVTSAEEAVRCREAFVLASRVYQTESGFSGQPSETWVRAALRTS